MCERELESEQNCNLLTPTLMAISVSFPFSWAAQPGAWGPSLSGTCSLIQNLLPTATAQSWAWGPTLLGAGFLYRLLSPTDWISCAPSHIVIQRPPSSCGRHNFALIQSVHGQGYNILIFLDRMHLLFIQVNFLFWQPGRVVGQYATVLSHCRGAIGLFSSFNR